MQWIKEKKEKKVPIPNKSRITQKYLRPTYVYVNLSRRALTAITMHVEAKTQKTQIHDNKNSSDSYFLFISRISMHVNAVNHSKCTTSDNFIYRIKLYTKPPIFFIYIGHIYNLHRRRTTYIIIHFSLIMRNFRLKQLSRNNNTIMMCMPPRKYWSHINRICNSTHITIWSNNKQFFM